MQSTDMPCSLERSALAGSKESEGPSTRDRHKDVDFDSDADSFPDTDTNTWSPSICELEVLDAAVVCVLVARYYTISNRIKSLKVSITKRALQLPAGGFFFVFFAPSVGCEIK